MKDYHERLVKLLLEKNEQISPNQALTWVELMWDDFETTAAKAGRDYLGSEMTERIVRQWIENYGDRLHDFIAKNPKYQHFLNQDKNSL
ncbi:YfhJ family protein [Bacillus sp. OK048]|uniref:YfhJ family protein n=1 Tax=Bacillus sp. OK048 TaxID=1882761 RepID=UPI0008889EFD|nr:YfhJ family protein [Bacillus sp. OK048]SDM54462.1 WVELL protein [Bacillus sp. OK048]